jgi:hypothetical protein
MKTIKRFLLAAAALMLFAIPAGATPTISQSQILLHVLGTYFGAGNLYQPQVPIAFQQSYTISNGSGANQADMIFQDQRTLAASATENLDLQTGALLDIFGNAIALSKVKAIVVTALGTNTNNVLVGGAGSNAFTGPFGSTTDVNTVVPGGTLVLVAPTAGGYTVDGTHKLLKIANSSSGTQVIYNIIIFGVE